MDVCLLFGLVMGRLDPEEGIDKEDVADPHALLTIPSHRLVAAILDKDE